MSKREASEKLADGGIAILSGPMANPQLDQFVQALIWKAVPPIILAGIGAILLREFLQWLGRKAKAAGRRRRAERDVTGQASPQWLAESEGRGLRIDDSGLENAPDCPVCNASMVKRTAKRPFDSAQGRLANPGSAFWGCSKYPDCRGMRAS